MTAVEDVRDKVESQIAEKCCMPPPAAVAGGMDDDMEVISKATSSFLRRRRFLIMKRSGSVAERRERIRASARCRTARVLVKRS